MFPSSREFVGVGTPQANPTVEIEFRRMLRGPVETMTTRLTSSSATVEQRLCDYLEGLPSALETFGTLPLRLFAFACTGSSYVVDDAHADDVVRAAEQRSQVPIVTAVQAIRRELEGRGARRIAMLAPYPEDLCDTACRYWKRLGFDIVALERIDIGMDTRAIYDLDDGDVETAVARVDTSGADVLLLSGTGMPTLAALERATFPTLSSNFCLATEILRRLQHWPASEAANIHELIVERKDRTHA